jgi:hypothetical protein
MSTERGFATIFACSATVIYSPEDGEAVGSKCVFESPPCIEGCLVITGRAVESSSLICQWRLLTTAARYPRPIHWPHGVHGLRGSLSPIPSHSPLSPPLSFLIADG